MCHMTQSHELCSHWPQEILQCHPEKRGKNAPFKHGKTEALHLSHARAKQRVMHLHSGLGEDTALRGLPCSLHAHVPSSLL